jgi:REP element-mobilizing transposase RayT
MNFIIWGILARARTLYPVKVCHFVFMANHFHMLLVVDDPEDVSKFIGYTKAEIAHAINILLGRTQKTIWSEGYDSPVILTSENVLHYINYIYTNPTKPNLVDSIDQYPGVSSWQMFTKDISDKAHKHLSRDSIPRLAFAALTISEQRKLVQYFLDPETRGSEETFTLEPYAWMECFSEYRDASQQEVKKLIIDTVRASEKKLKEKRKKDKKSVIGATSLRRQSMLKDYAPKKHSRRMICISSDIALRKRFISHFKTLCARAEKMYEKWKLGHIHLRVPPGMLAPAVPVLAADLLSVT